ncbi:MAG: DNA methyltransferase, partial [Clostridia bacterium]|nr:DNA methyltransferase [Clostridia bacterium]
LNSSAASFFLNKKFRSVKLLRSHVEAVPIPRADEATAKRVEESVDALIAGGTSDVYEKLDSLIFDLYGLTDEEIKTVRSSVSEKNRFLL